MTRKELKTEYLTDAFFWINEANHLQIQMILQKFGIRCHAGSGFIQWHNGFVNLCTFEKDKFHDFEYYQSVDVWLPDARYGEPKNIERLLYYYQEIKDIESGKIANFNY